MTDLDLIVINNQGRRFGIRIVRPGMGYGIDDKVLYQPGEDHHQYAKPDDFMVEFYDYTYAGDTSGFGPRGQFVARYYASTLLERNIPWSGLDLVGCEPAWKVDGSVMDQVRRLIDNEEGT